MVAKVESGANYGPWVRIMISVLKPLEAEIVYVNISRAQDGHIGKRE